MGVDDAKHRSGDSRRRSAFSIDHEASANQTVFADDEVHELGKQASRHRKLVDDSAAMFGQALLSAAKGAVVYNLIGDVVTVDDVLAEIRRNVPDARLSASDPPLPIAPGIAERGLDNFLPGAPRPDGELTAAPRIYGAAISHAIRSSLSARNPSRS